MNYGHRVCLIILIAVVRQTASADPVLTVTDIGINGGGNHEWRVDVEPDVNLFATTSLGLGGSVDVELAFEITGSDLLGATVNTTDWPNDTPGNNPFTTSVTQGAVLDLAGDTLFASLGSEFFTSGAAVEVLVIETMGSGATTVSWGGHTVLPDTAQQYVGSRIAQAGLKFDSYQGMIPQLVEDADFDDNGFVEGADFLSWQRGSGNGTTHAEGDADFNDVVDGSDLEIWESQYGGPPPVRAAVATIPEPASGFLSAIAAGFLTLARIRYFKMYSDTQA